MHSDAPVEISSRDYLFKVVDFLQQNWALIDQTPSGRTVFFFGDTTGVFDRLQFSSAAEAEQALFRNGFSRFAKDREAQGFIAVPQAPFHEGHPPNGPIYFSGMFCR